MRNFLRSFSIVVIPIVIVASIFGTTLEVSAAISAGQPWSSLYAGTSTPGTLPYTVNAGSNRMLVVGVSTTRSTSVTQTVTVTYGGQSMTQAIGDGTTSSTVHTYLLYLQEAGITAASNTVGGLTNAIDYAAYLPNVGFYGSRKLYVKEQENILVGVWGATSGQVYAATARVSVINDKAARGVAVDTI